MIYRKEAGPDSFLNGTARNSFLLCPLLKINDGFYYNKNFKIVNVLNFFTHIFLNIDVENLKNSFYFLSVFVYQSDRALDTLMSRNKTYFLQ